MSRFENTFITTSFLKNWISMEHKAWTAKEALIKMPAQALSASYRYSKFLHAKYPVQLESIRALFPEQYAALLHSNNPSSYGAKEVRANQSNFNKITRHQVALLCFKAETISGINPAFSKKFRDFLISIVATEETPYERKSMNDYVKQKFADRKDEAIALFSGVDKERLAVFLKTFGDELERVMQNGIMSLDLVNSQPDHLAYHGLVGIAVAFLEVSGVLDFADFLDKLKSATRRVVY